jgi:hypothetical protein
VIILFYMPDKMPGGRIAWISLSTLCDCEDCEVPGDARISTTMTNRKPLKGREYNSGRPLARDFLWLPIFMSWTTSFWDLKPYIVSVRRFSVVA